MTAARRARQKWIHFAGCVKPAIGLSPPASRVRIVTGLPAAIQACACRSDIALLGWKFFATLKQKLGPHQADAVDVGRIEAFELARPVTLIMTRTSSPVVVSAGR